jgi:hypothetical protein
MELVSQIGGGALDGLEYVGSLASLDPLRRVVTSL